MKFLQLLFIVLGAYLLFKLVKPFFSISSGKGEVKGSRKKRKLNLDKDNIQDAEFKDIDNSDNNKS